MFETTLEFFVPLLAMFTLGALLVAAWRGARRTRALKEDPRVPGSALATDSDSHEAQTDTSIKAAKKAA